MTNKYPSLFLYPRCNLCSGDYAVLSFVCFCWWMLAPVHISLAAHQQILNALEPMSGSRCEVPSYLGATAK